ncbi:hypothetical protein LWI29_001542 [Acer saccharum]|uniref:Uncharacterized protein n=1 Tax=Acer saccharum TaxID=4024 RepID=A0AA39S6S8_ACESA|nr:hypothetical protein LWI29_001542 [Acer saccharum]
MDELYGLHSTVDYPSMQHTAENNLMVGNTTTGTLWTNVYDHHHISSSSSSTPPQVVTTFNPVVYGSQQFGSGSSGLSDAASMVAQLQTNNNNINNNNNTSEEAEVSSAIRARIASHPLYPKLLQSYIDCHKVGSPPEMTDVLNEIIISSESDVNKRSAVVSGCLGADPELDEFMETYCDILNKYKSDLSKPFDEATTFLNSMETQLSNLCNGGVSRSYGSVEGGGGSSDDEEEELSGGGETEEEVQEECIIRAQVDRELKDKLIRKYGGYISSLKYEFSKKKKKGKLPKQARQTLFEWWNTHYRWPYPTEADKIALAESTGLDQKQINNWFINQRKRHWKPSDNMQLSVMETLYGGGTGTI